MKIIEKNFFKKNNKFIFCLLTLHLLLSCHKRSIEYNQILISNNKSEIETISNIILQNITIDSVVINENYIPDKYFDSIVNETIKFKNYKLLKDLKELKIGHTIKDLKFRYPYILKSNFNEESKNHILINYISFSKPYINKKNNIIIYSEYYVNSFHAGGNIYIFSLDKNRKIILKSKYLIWQS